MSRQLANARLRQRRPPGAMRCAGFTLLELLIVVALVALVSTISWPSVRRSLSRGEFQRTVDEVSALLAEGRSRAAARARPHIVQVDSREAQLLLLEVRFDEADLSHFEAAGRTSAGPRRSSRSSPDLLGDELAEDDVAGSATLADDPTLPDFAQRDPLPQGVRLKVIETLDLPEGFTCRLVDVGADTSPLETDPNLPANLPGGGDAVADIEPEDLTALPFEAKPTRFVFDASGRTADAQLELAAEDGAYVRLSIDASSEHGRPEVRRRPMADMADTRRKENAR